jgi:hypothetical protein
MDVSGNDCQGDVAFESVDSVIRTLVETMHLQGIDGGFNCGVCAAQEFELGGAFSLAVRFPESSFSLEARSDPEAP